MNNEKSKNARIRELQHLWNDPTISAEYVLLRTAIPVDEIKAVLGEKILYT